MIKKIFLLIIFIGVLFPLIKIKAATGLTASPVKIVENVSPDSNLSLKFTFRHDYDKSQVFHITFKSFTLINNNTEISFDKELDTHVLDWIENYQNDIEIAPNENKDFTLDLKIPKDADPGGYSFAMFLETVASKGDDNSAVIKQSVGIPILINIRSVLGSSIDKAFISKFSLPSITFGNTAKLEITVSNDGKTDLIPLGSTRIREIFNLAYESSSNFNDMKNIVVHNSDRTFTQDVHFNSIFPAIYRVETSIVYGDSNDVITNSSDILIIPVWTIILITIILFAVVVLLRRKNDKAKKDS